jgi:tetratricopeptide (TPR) repeat protein
MRIGPYDYTLPSWWESVQVEVPEHLKDWEQVSAYVSKRYGDDSGTKESWKEALKIWAISDQRLGGFPGYLAHCHRTGGEYKRAVEIYTALYELADTQKDDRDWFRTYLAYCAGGCFVSLNDYEKALVWYKRSAKYVGNADPVVHYYASESAEKVRQLTKR